MLTQLRLRDFILVEKLELSFGPGFTVLTGETGAGKSILIEALGLLLGQRLAVNVVRRGAERCDLTSEFDIDRLPALQEWLTENDLADESACILRRVIDATGRSRAYINGHAASLQQLREVGTWLIEIHGQHGHQALVQSKTQRAVLDHYANAVPEAERAADLFSKWQTSLNQKLEWEKNAAAYAKEREELEWQVREFDALKFADQEWVELQQEHARLTHAASLMEAVNHGQDILAESELAILPQLHALIARLQNLAEFDPEISQILEILTPATIQLQETEYSLKHYLQRLDLDPARVIKCEEKIEQIYSLARKHRVKERELTDFFREKRIRLEFLNSLDSANKLAEQETAAKEQYMAAAQRLSKKRNAAAKKLSAAVTELMQRLAMQGGRFDIRLNTLAEPGACGLEQAEFLVSPHKGMELNEFSKIASGGEISRISLALHVAASDATQTPCLVFDEVDVGIGGGVAEIVGGLLKAVARNRQVLCITHLPQVAAQGEVHLQISKTSANGEVLSQVLELDYDHRIDEVARMLGGVKITETTRKHAAEMLSPKNAS